MISPTPLAKARTLELYEPQESSWDLTTSNENDAVMFRDLHWNYDLTA
jgi:hypothetical protein